MSNINYEISGHSPKSGRGAVGSPAFGGGRDRKNGETPPIYLLTSNGFQNKL